MGHGSGTELLSRDPSTIPIPCPGGKGCRAPGGFQPGAGLFLSHPPGRAGTARGQAATLANFAKSCHIYTYTRIYMYMHTSNICNDHTLPAHTREANTPLPPKKIKLIRAQEKGWERRSPGRGERPSVSTSADRSSASSPGVTSPCQSKRHNRGNRVMGSEEPRNSPASPTRQLRDVARRLLQAVGQQRRENG